MKLYKKFKSNTKFQIKIKLLLLLLLCVNLIYYLIETKYVGVHVGSRQKHMYTNEKEKKIALSFININCVNNLWYILVFLVQK